MSKHKHKNDTLSTPLMIAIVGGIFTIGMVIGIVNYANLTDTSNDIIVDSAIPATQLISAADYQNDFGDREHVLIDVRTPAEFESGYIEGAVNINVETLADRLDEIPQDTLIVVYCRSGNRSAQAATILNEAGYTPVYDLGGILDWTAAGYDVTQ